MKNIKAVLKIFTLIILSAIILYTFNSLILTAILFILLVIFQFNQPKLSILNRLKVLLPLGVFIIIFQIIFNQSPLLIDKFLFGFVAFMRIAIVSILVLFYISVTSPMEIISVFWFLPKNFKLLLTMTFYLISAIFGESEKIILIQKTRGLKSTIWNPIPLMIPLLHRIFKRAETLALSISSRGYEG